MSALARVVRTFKIAFWLGWKIQSNWTDPLYFFIYSVARPLGGVLILVFMFFVVARGQRGAMLDFFVVGSAFWPLVVWSITGFAWGVLEDRESYKTVRYIYTAPVPFWVYLAGRGFAQAIAGVPSAVLTLALGRFVLGVPLTLSLETAAYGLAAFLLGAVGLVAIGMFIVGIMFTLSGEAWRFPEAVGQSLFLLCGAVFPIAVLPRFLEPLAEAIPITYWLEAMRRALIPGTTVSSFPGRSDAEILVALAGWTLLTVAAAILMFTVGLNSARSKGLLDAEVWY